MVPTTIDRCGNSVKLTPISPLEGLCPEKAITFICQIDSNINDARHLTWHSEEYIQDLIQITVFDNMPMIILPTLDPMQNDTNLKAIYNATGTSLLVLKPRADAPNATITCINENTRCSNSTSFRLLGMRTYTILLMHTNNNIIIIIIQVFPGAHNVPLVIYNTRTSRDNFEDCSYQYLYHLHLPPPHC